MYVKIQGIETDALIDTHSEIMRVSENFFKNNKNEFKNWKILPIVGTSVVGATGGKPIKLKHHLTNFSVKKGTLPLRWVSSPGPFDCGSNCLSSELRRFHKTFLTESIHANLATDISWTIYKFSFYHIKICQICTVNSIWS